MAESAPEPQEASASSTSAPATVASTVATTASTVVAETAAQAEAETTAAAVETTQPAPPPCAAGYLEVGDGTATGKADQVRALELALGVEADGEYDGELQQAIISWATASFDERGASEVASISPSSTERGGIPALGLALLGVLCPGVPLGCPDEIFQAYGYEPWVILLQKDLIAAGFGERIDESGGADGSFGQGTHDAVFAWADSIGHQLLGEEGQPWIRPAEWVALGRAC